MPLTQRTRLPLLLVLTFVASLGAASPAGAAPDREPPTVPTNLRVTAATTGTIAIAWTASTDNRGVAGYGVYRGSKRVARTQKTSYSYSGLSCGKSHRLGVDAYDRRNNRSSIAWITASTAPCPTASSMSPAYPSTYYAGPLGQRNILPPKHPGAFLGIWDQAGWTQIYQREKSIGRKFDILVQRYNAAPGKCYDYTPFADGKSQQQVSHGAIPLVGWSPGFTLEEINAGMADTCFRDVARRAKAFGHRFFLFAYHEHNGYWMRYSGCGAKFISAWRRTVSTFRNEGANNIAWVWSPSEGYRTCAFESYPGDDWVDWVSPGGYNHNSPNAWCGYHAGWCEFWEIFRFNPTVSLHDLYGLRKPIMFNETGTLEDPATPGRKGQWFRLARDSMKSDFSYGKALVYFDVLYSDGNWRIDSSPTSLQGFRDLALDPHFRTRG